MGIPQRTRAKGLAQSEAEDARIIEALKKASKDAKQRAALAGTPFISSRKKTWPVAK